MFSSDIYQGKELLASGEESMNGNNAAVLEADIEDPSKGDVYIYGGSSTKDIFGIFADYYDPDVVVNRTVSGKINYSGSENGIELVFTDQKDNTEYKISAVNGDYSVQLRQNRKYTISVKDANGVSEKVAVTLDTNNLALAKKDKTFDIDLVDIAETNVTGDVVVHDINNDGSSLDLSKVTLIFTANDDSGTVYRTGITDNKIDIAMMPNRKYTVTAEGADGYELSPMSSSYVMAAGDTAPFKNILFNEVLGEVPFAKEVHVGADKEYKTVSDAVTAIKNMTSRPAGEDGRISVLVDAGTYTEQVILSPGYITLKATDENNKPHIEWYYGGGYLYYSAKNGLYSEDAAVAKTARDPVTNWGHTIKVEGIII